MISLLITVVLQQQTRPLSEFLPCDSGLRYSNCFGSWALSTLADFWGDWKTRILTGTRKYSPTPTPHTQTFFKENKTVRRRMIWCYRLRMMSTVTQLELLDSSPITMQTIDNMPACELETFSSQRGGGRQLSHKTHEWICELSWNNTLMLRATWVWRTNLHDHSELILLYLL